MNHTMAPYLELLIRNGLAERTEGGVTRYKTTAKGTKRSALQGAEETTQGCMRQLLNGWLNWAHIDLPPSQSSRILKERPGWEALLRKSQIKVHLSRGMHAN